MRIYVVAAVLTVALAPVFQSSAADQSKTAAVSTNKATAIKAAAATNDEVVARVNGTEIKRKELANAVQAFTVQMSRRGRAVPPAQSLSLEHDVLDQLIGRELLLEEGNKHVAADVDKKVQDQVDQMKTQLGGEEQLKKTLAETGITPEEYTRQVRDNIIIRDTIQTAIDKVVKISPEEAKDFYDKNPAQFKQPEQACASHILIRCPSDATADVKKAKRAQIEAARALVKGGEKFADVARKFSEDPGSAPKGGDLGCFGHGQMVPEFDAAAFSAKTNEVTDVITTQYGYHVLLVTSRKPAQTIPFEQVKDDLTQYLKQRQGNDVARTYVADLRKAAKVDVLLPPLPAAPTLGTPPVAAPAK
jgi:peptidyl-prolyl cis-trans isomerase C